MFHCPHQFRERKGPLASTDAYGNNGLFILTAGFNIGLDEQGNQQKTPYFLYVIASDTHGFEHVTIAVNSQMEKRWAKHSEIAAVKRTFWDIKDRVIMYIPDEAPDAEVMTVQLWRKPGWEKDLPIPPKELFGIEKKKIVQVKNPIIKSIFGHDTKLPEA